MKTNFTKMLAVTVMAFVVIIITSSKKAKAAFGDDVKVTELSHVKHINKITITGNVEVYLTQGYAENLKVYDDYYAKNALVQWNNGELRISSYNKEKLVIGITVTNLNNIEASGDVIIRTMNKLSGINLDISLTGDAKATLEAQVVNLNSVVAGTSSLELSGDAETQSMSISGSARFNASKFTSENSSIVLSDNAHASFNQDGKTTEVKTIANTPAKSDILTLDSE